MYDLSTLLYRGEASEIPRWILRRCAYGKRILRFMYERLSSRLVFVNTSQLFSRVITGRAPEILSVSVFSNFEIGA